MKTLLLIPVVALSLYLIYIYLKYEMTYSISSTYKVVRGWEKPWFTVTLWSVALPIIIVALENIPGDGVKILFFLAGALICLVGAAPLFWEGGLEYRMHMIGSYGGIGLGMIASLIHFWSFFTVFFVALFALFTASQMLTSKYRISNHIYWIEVSALITVILILLIN